MSTRCYIAKVEPDNSVKAIYCHFDGYPEGVGKTLLDHYVNEEKINALLELGDISSLGELVSPSPDDPSSKKDVTVAYHRDRGEDKHEARPFIDEEELGKKVDDDIFIEYTYLFKSGKWFVRLDSEWKDLKEVLKEIEQECP